MSDSENTVPYGYCQCGCGQKTNLAKKTFTKKGVKKGEPHRYVTGHHGPIHPKPIESRYEVDGATGCWVWSGATSHGYGRASWEGKSEQAHRLMYRLLRGEIPEGLYLDHICRNKACVNPDHLEPVSPAENSRRGNGAKLNMEQVREIRVVTDALCAKYGVKPGTLAHIAQRTRWVDDE